MINYFIKFTKRVVRKLIANKFYSKNCKLKEITESENEISAKVDNNGKMCILDIPKKILGVELEEDIFVSNLINIAK